MVWRGVKMVGQRLCGRPQGRARSRQGRPYLHTHPPESGELLAGSWEGVNDVGLNVSTSDNG